MRHPRWIKVGARKAALKDDREAQRYDTKHPHNKNLLAVEYCGNGAHAGRAVEVTHVVAIAVRNSLPGGARLLEARGFRPGRLCGNSVVFR